MIFQIYLLDQIQPLPFPVPTVRADPEKANPKIGVGKVIFSHDNKYLATRNGEPIFHTLYDVTILAV